MFINKLAKNLLNSHFVAWKYDKLSICVDEVPCWGISLFTKFIKQYVTLSLHGGSLDYGSTRTARTLHPHHGPV